MSNESEEVLTEWIRSQFRDVSDEIAELRRTVEQQKERIDSLTESLRITDRTVEQLSGSDWND